MINITFVPTAGLCNRINAMMCAFSLVGKVDSLTVYWEKSRDCYADFDDLFLPLPPPVSKVQTLKSFILKPAARRNLFLPKIMRHFRFSASLDGGMISAYTWEQICNKYNMENAYISSYNRFCIFDVASVYKDFSHYFVPQHDIQQKISEVTSQFEGNVIGVHIRRTDNVAAIKNNPLEKYIRLMDEETKKNPSVRFYLASDDEKVKSFFTERYGAERIITKKWKLERNSLEGMKDAVAELWCLASTSKIIGSTNSTYSSMASHIFGAELIV